MIHVRCIPDAWENHFPMLRTQYPISVHMGPMVCLSFTTMVHNLKTIKGSLACPCCHRPFFYPCISQAMSRLNSWLEISFALLIHILFQCTCANAISSAGTPVKRQEEQAAIESQRCVQFVSLKTGFDGKKMCFNFDHATLVCELCFW